MVSVLPLITVKHKNYIWYDVGPTCQVCCLSQGSVDVYYRYYDPLMTNNVTLYQEVFGNPVHVHFTATKSHHSGIGNLYKIVFSRYQYQPGFYELRITNRYGSTRVRFNILYSDAGECQFMVIIYYTLCWSSIKVIKILLQVWFERHFAVRGALLVINVIINNKISWIEQGKCALFHWKFALNSPFKTFQLVLKFWKFTQEYYKTIRIIHVIYMYMILQ